jgi:hypothetical protein
MQQRRLRLGDILDDYCPRERRITNHVVVAMIDETVKQTRCTTCDADHEYKEARVPASRRRKPADPGSVDADPRPVPSMRAAEAPLEEEGAESLAPDPADDLPLSGASGDADDESDTPAGASEEDWPVHRRLIRATLPRPEGQTPERKAPDFTFRQSGGRFEGNRNGARGRGRPRQGQGGPGGQHARSGTRPGGSPPSGPRHGNRSGNAAGNRAGRPQGQGRGNRQGQPGGNQGRKRGR